MKTLLSTPILSIGAIPQIISTASLLLFLVHAPLLLFAEDKPLNEKEKIETLIKHLEGLKNATFIRNNSDYDSKMAARFLRSKWEAQSKEIRTALDFIDKLASISSKTGKPYEIRFKDGRQVKCGEYLKAELKKLEKTSREIDKPSALQ